MCGAWNATAMWRIALLCITCCCAMLTSLRAQIARVDMDQSRAAFQQGQRVRIAFHCATPIAAAKDAYLFCAEAIGVLEAWENDSIVLDLDDEQGRFAISLPAVARLEVSRHRHTRFVRGAVVGLGAGTLAGLVFGWGATGGDPDKLSVPAVLAGAGVGLVGGVFFGVRTRVDEWRDIPLTPSAVVVELPVILRF